LRGVDVIVHVLGGSSAPGGGYAALDENDGSRPKHPSHWRRGLLETQARITQAASKSSWIRWAEFRSGDPPSPQKSPISSRFWRHRERRRSPGASSWSTEVRFRRC